jgi:hypothetical protein
MCCTHNFLSLWCESQSPIRRTLEMSKTSLDFLTQWSFLFLAMANEYVRQHEAWCLFRAKRLIILKLLLWHHRNESPSIVRCVCLYICLNLDCLMCFSLKYSFDWMWVVIAHPVTQYIDNFAWFLNAVILLTSCRGKRIRKATRGLKFISRCAAWCAWRPCKISLRIITCLYVCLMSPNFIFENHLVVPSLFKSIS